MEQIETLHSGRTLREILEAESDVELAELGGEPLVGSGHDDEPVDVDVLVAEEHA